MDIAGKEEIPDQAGWIVFGSYLKTVKAVGSKHGTRFLRAKVFFGLAAV